MWHLAVENCTLNFALFCYWIRKGASLLWPNNIRSSKHFVCSCSVYLGKVVWQSRDTVNIDVTIVHYSCDITAIWTGAEVINHLKCKEWDKINKRLYFSRYLADCCSTKQWYQWIIVDLNLKQLVIPQSTNYSMMLHWRVTVKCTLLLKSFPKLWGSASIRKIFFYQAVKVT